MDQYRSIDGWYFEGPDESVGLFGDMVVHEECLLWSDDEPVLVTESTQIMDHPTIEGLLDVTVTYTCQCGAQTATTTQEPA